MAAGKLHKLIFRVAGLFLIILPSLALAQKPGDNTKHYDTVTVFNCSYSIIHDGDSVYYKINGKNVAREDFENVARQQKAQKKCKPCVLKLVNLDGSLDSQGIFYLTCPGSPEQSEFKTKGRESENTYIHVNSCKDGEWLFYSKDGNVREIKFFDHGEELKSKSKINP